MLESVLRSVVFLTSDYPLSEKSRFGTGIILVKGDTTYIATAAHVSKDMNKDSYIVFQDNDGKAAPARIGDWTIDGTWINHPIADLSLLQLLPRDKRKYPVNFIGFDISLVEKEKQPVPLNMRLVVAGFPLALGVLDNSSPMSGKTLEYISPLIFETFPSSKFITMPRGDTKTNQIFIQLQNPSMQGYSGGPVFDLKYNLQNSGYITYRSGPPSIVGFTHGTMGDNTGGKLSTMTPAFYLWDMIH